MKEVQIGGMYVQDWVKIGFPPAQPEGEAELTVLDWVLSGWHDDQFE